MIVMEKWEDIDRGGTKFQLCRMSKSRVQLCNMRTVVNHVLYTDDLPE